MFHMLKEDAHMLMVEAHMFKAELYFLNRDLCVLVDAWIVRGCVSLKVHVLSVTYCYIQKHNLPCITTSTQNILLFSSQFLVCSLHLLKGEV